MTDQANHFLKMTKETIADTINKTENINQNEKIMFSMMMKKIIIENITYGALEVWLPCNCQIWDKKTIIVENTFPRDSRITDYHFTHNSATVDQMGHNAGKNQPNITNDRKHNELHI
uniref:Uncharacterized protein n=1 Tax=Cacopsylla melanoneura TaxID=428564 RepID=A0A8D8UJU6_9HEMI